MMILNNFVSIFVCISISTSNPQNKSQTKSELDNRNVRRRNQKLRSQLLASQRFQLQTANCKLRLISCSGSYGAGHLVGVAGQGFNARNNPPTPTFITPHNEKKNLIRSPGTIEWDAKSNPWGLKCDLVAWLWSYKG
jgi:hypothetical protein